MAERTPEQVGLWVEDVPPRTRVVLRGDYDSLHAEVERLRRIARAADIYLHSPKRETREQLETAVAAALTDHREGER